MSDVVYLHAGSDRLHGWTEVSVYHSMEALASVFDLSYSEKYDLLNDVSLKLGDSASVFLDNTKILTGWLEDIEPSYDDESHSIAAAGRNLLCDLVDCPLDQDGLQNKQFVKLKLDAIARELCKPFDIEVVIDEGVDLGEPFTQTIDEGQTIHEFLDQLARYRGLRLVSDLESRLHITKPGIRRSASSLELGKNIKGGSGRFSTRDLYSSYTILAQITNFQSGHSPDVVARQKGREAEALFGSRHRPFVATSNKASTSNECQTRAKFEKRTRGGRAQGVTYTVAGWRDEYGELWQINTVIPVYDPWMGIDGDRLISDVRYIQRAGSKTCELTLKPLSAFDIDSTPESKQIKFF